MAFGHSISRLGALLAPHMVFSLMPVNPRLALVLIVVALFIGSTMALLLPIETKGRPLAQTFEEEDDATHMKLQEKGETRKGGSYETFPREGLDEGS